MAKQIMPESRESAEIVNQAPGAGEAPHASEPAPAPDSVQPDAASAAHADSRETRILARLRGLERAARDAARKRIAGSRVEKALDGLPKRVERELDGLLDRVGLVRKSRLEIVEQMERDHHHKAA